ncbi:MAG TPA: DUF2255 family protein [Candidatus Binatia bacterium]|jgi:hypothetical protein
MGFLKWFGAVVGAIVLTVLLLDTFGGYLFDGPLGPIPGGALSGPVNSTENPDWSKIGKELELEIRPSRPWSLHIWGVVVDGELYSPSAFGAWRRWPKVVLEDPRVRLRTNGQVYGRLLERVTDPALKKRVGEALAEKYGFDAKKAAADDTTWYFHYTTQASQR